MRRFWGFAGIVLASAIVSCNSSKKAAESKADGAETATRPTIACAELSAQLAQPNLAWIVEDSAVLDNLTNLSRPSAFKVYSLDTVQARAFFKKAGEDAAKKTGIKTVLPLPDPLGCRIYTLKNAGVMDKKLEEKYPEISALRGTDQHGETDVRLNYDGKWVKGQVNMSGALYLITPVRNNGKIYYLVYKRSDSNEKKEDFEGTPGRTGN